MQNITKEIAYVIAIAVLLFAASCRSGDGTNTNIDTPVAALPNASPVLDQASPSPSPEIPDLQAELLDDRNKVSAHGLGSFDFKIYSYDMPRGWENPDGCQI